MNLEFKRIDLRGLDVRLTPLPSYEDHGVAALDRALLESTHLPYLELREGRPGPLHARGVLLALDIARSADLPAIWNQRIVPADFRSSLYRQIGRAETELTLKCPPWETIQTGEWGFIVDQVRAWPPSSLEARARILVLLNKLGLYAETRSLSSLDQNVDPAQGEAASRIAFAHASARQALSFDGRTPRREYTPDDVARLAELDSEVGPVSFAASIKLVTYFTRFLPDLAQAKRFLGIAEKRLHQLKSTVSPFHHGLLRSGYSRAAGLIPWMERDRLRAEEDMSRSEALARSLEGKTDVEQYLASENLSVVLESRSREAFFAGDYATALVRIQESLDLDPMDAKGYLHRGQVEWSLGRHDEAGKTFMQGAHLGPPAGQACWYLAGVMYEESGEPELASTCYLRCLELDHGAVSPVWGLHRVSKTLGNAELSRWIDIRMNELFHVDRVKSLTTDDGDERLAADASLTRRETR